MNKECETIPLEEGKKVKISPKSSKDKAIPRNLPISPPIDPEKAEELRREALKKVRERIELLEKEMEDKIKEEIKAKLQGLFSLAKEKGPYGSSHYGELQEIAKTGGSFRIDVLKEILKKGMMGSDFSQLIQPFFREDSPLNKKEQGDFRSDAAYLMGILLIEEPGFPPIDQEEKKDLVEFLKGQQDKEEDSFVRGKIEDLLSDYQGWKIEEAKEKIRETK